MRFRSTRRRRITRMVLLAIIGLAITAAEVEATIFPTAPEVTARSGQTATAIVDASGTVTGVLVAGGRDSTGGVLDSAELYSTATGTWSPAGALTTGRYNAQAVALPVSAARPQGGVLVEGGLNANAARIPDVEIYDRATNAWSSGGTLGDARTGEALTRAGDQIYVIGGIDNAGLVNASVERFNDGARATWTTVAPMGTPRQNLAATEILGGKILVTGGADPKITPLASSEIYDPAADTWTDVAPMTGPRMLHTATAVSGGAQVLVAGGQGPAAGGGRVRISSAELYTVATNSWQPAGTMAVARSGATAVALDSNLVAVVGGNDPAASMTSAETWSASDGWAGPTGPGTVEPLDVDRQFSATAALSPSAGMLVTGGYSGNQSQTTATAITLVPTRPIVPTPAPTPVPVITPATGPLVTAPTPTPAPASGPVQGRTLISGAITGTVLIKIGTGPFVKLLPGQTIPVGATIDATNGHVVLIGAIGSTTQSADFWGGVFTVTQPDGEHGQVDLRVVGKPECRATTKKAKASSLALSPRTLPFLTTFTAAAKKKKVPPRIWGDGHGNFQTRGANSAATVRGTKWLVEERCEGTFTQVARGVVSITDFARNKTFLLPAPRTYLARPKGAK